MYLDPADLFECESLPIAQSGGGFDRGMRQVTGGVVLEQGLADQEAAGVALQGSDRWLGAGVRCCEALRNLDDRRVAR